VELKVLELINTPMDFNGQTLYPLRMAGRMTGVRADFLTYYVADERIRDMVAAQGATLHTAPPRLRNPVGYVRFVARIVRENGYGIVHAHGNSCTLALDLLGARLGGAKVRIAHSHNSRCGHPLLHRLLRPLFDRLYTHAMACGEEAGRWLFGGKPFAVSRNAIDTDAFAFDPEARARVREELGVHGATVLGCVGGLTELKNQSFLIGLMPELPDCRLVLVGDGPKRAALEEQARELGVAERVIFTGLRTDVPRVLQAMDVMLLPSLFEGFPTVALEWQCAGLPVLMSESVTRDCAMTEGVIFLPPEPEKWIRAVPEPVDRDDRSRKGRQAVARAGYDLADAAARLEADYRSFLK